MAKNDGGPAFPTSSENYDEVNLEGSGMTLRDYFAAKAMPLAAEVEANGTVGDAEQELGLKSGGYKYDTHWPLLVARTAYRMADAMLEARNA